MACVGKIKVPRSSGILISKIIFFQLLSAIAGGENIRKFAVNTFSGCNTLPNKNL